MELAVRILNRSFAWIGRLSWPCRAVAENAATKRRAVQVVNQRMRDLQSMEMPLVTVDVSSFTMSERAGTLLGPDVSAVLEEQALTSSRLADRAVDVQVTAAAAVPADPFRRKCGIATPQRSEPQVVAAPPKNGMATR